MKAIAINRPFLLGQASQGARGRGPAPGLVAHLRIENVKFHQAVGDLSADGLVVMTWAFQAA